MAYAFSKTIVNNYLSKSKTIKANTQYELDIKVHQQYEIWNKQEQAQRQRDEIKRQSEQSKQKAENLTKQAQEKIEGYETILQSSISRNCILDWDALLQKYTSNTFTYPYFRYDKPEPQKPDEYLIKQQTNVPEKSFLEIFSKKKLQYRLQQEEKLKQNLTNAFQQYYEECEQYEKDKNCALQEYEAKKSDALNDFTEKENRAKNSVISYNDNIKKIKSDYIQGIPSAIIYMLSAVFDASEYPDEFSGDYDMNFEDSSKTLVVSLEIPTPDKFTKSKEYRYVASTKTIKEIELKPKEFDTLYDKIVKQAALKTIYEVFTSDTEHHIENVVFNGWVNGINKATGQAFNACIISLSVSRASFDEIIFSQIDIDACIKNLKALYSGNLSLLAPVKPIMALNTEDSRFIQSNNIIDNISDTDNLATMDWEDFEHLVRELFSKYFSNEGQEVKVTQSSRDGGVDAIAFDPDPIRGGKFVIQAKRYNRVVPVSAVRDLYGTMINEGAAKGILVTTSHFGSDSRDFVKDKPISLIDGNNLIHMFSEYGYNVHIELQK